MRISAIAAIDQKGVLGKNNTIPWHLPADLKYFKKITLNHAVVMGSKTYASIGKPLPHRTNIILSKNPKYSAEGCLVFSSPKESIDYAKNHGIEEFFVIGGAQIFKAFWPSITKIYLTKIDTIVEGGDTWFPSLGSEWALTNSDCFTADEKNPYDYCFCEYIKHNG